MMQVAAVVEDTVGVCVGWLHFILWQGAGLLGVSRVAVRSCQGKGVDDTWRHVVWVRAWTLTFDPRAQRTRGMSRNPVNTKTIIVSSTLCQCICRI